jgi:hypothetical protein
MYNLTNICTTDLNMDGVNLAPGQTMQVTEVTAQHRALIESNAIAAEPTAATPSVAPKFAPKPASKPRQSEQEVS